MKLEMEFNPIRADITWIKFTSPLPLLMTGDYTGNLVLWKVYPKHKCLLHARNMFNTKESKATTACDYLFNSPKVLIHCDL